MTDLVFDLPRPVAIPVNGSAAAYPIRRIFCVGRNYAAHAAELGNEVDRSAPFYFTKSPAHAVLSGGAVPFPSGTAEYHHEMELAFTIGSAGFEIPAAQALEKVHSYGCALDMTRRDLQNAAKEKRRPWDLAKDVEASAIFGPLTLARDFAPGDQRIHLSVNGAMRQDASLAEMIHDVPAIIADLSQFYHLAPGDVILTGTPAGVGAVNPGDRLDGGIDGLEPITAIMEGSE